MKTPRVVFLTLFLGLPSYLMGQSVGEILGTVVDPTQAVIPNATVTASQRGTGLVRSTVTSGAGTYSIPSLPVGTYTVTATAQGFKVGSLEVTLDVDQQREVNFTLVVAASSTKVEVSAAASLLTTTNPTLGGLVTGQQVATLPLNGRDITNLVMLQPGVNYEINGFYFGSNVWSMNGNRGGTAASFLDSSETSDLQVGGLGATNFNLDAIDEFKVLQNNYSAEYGRGAGAIVELVSKSGTNQLHGSAFEFVRNSDFDSRNFFSTSVPPFRRNEFGVTLGGPVWLPDIYHGKDRTFFFFEYAGFRQRYGSPIVIPVPTPDERQGIFPITGANGQPDQLLVPLNPVSKYVLNHYPLPNLANGPFGANTFDFEYSIPEDHNQASGRIDHHFSEKDSLFARYTQSNQIQPVGDPVAAIEGAHFSGSSKNNQHNAGLTETHIFSPTLLNTLRLGWQYSPLGYFPGLQNMPQTAFEDGSFGNWGPDTSLGVCADQLYQLHDGVNWAKGRHSMSLGFEFRRLRAWELGASVGGPNGVFSFASGTPLSVSIPSASGLNNLAAGTPSPSSIVSFMVGDPAVYTRSLAFPGFGPPGGGFSPFGSRYSRMAGYFQDDMRLSRKFTLNLGLRYEYNTVDREEANRMADVVDDPRFKGGELYHQLILNPEPMYFPDHRGWGPRLGLAYKLDSKTVLRGGYGVFTNVIPNTYVDQNGLGFPYAAYGSTLSPQYSLTPLSVVGMPVVTDLQGNPMPPNGDTHKVPPNTPVNLIPVEAFFGGPLELNFISMHIRNGYTLASNITLERELPGDVVLQVAYVTNNAVHLWASEWPNAYTGALPQYTPYTDANPGLGEFELQDNHAHSTYNGLQVMSRKVSAQHGLQFQVSYTWAKAIDNASTVWNASVPNASMLPNNLLCYSCEKAVSGFDFPHTLTLNFVYNIPTDKWQALSVLPRRLTAGWQITSIVRAQSGFPFTVTSPYGTEEFGTDTYAGFQPTRPFLVQQPTFRSSGDPQEQFFSNQMINDQSEFLATPTVTVNGAAVQTEPGNLGRNTFRSDPFSNVDFSVIKDTKITERATIQFRSEFFNLLNQHAFASPVAVLGASGFGTSNSTVLSERQIQFALRLIF